MSSGCGDVLSLADLQTAKKHQIFEAEVITGKSGGVAGGADIDYATNAVTGQTQKTLPAVLRDAGFSPVSWDFSTGGTLTVNDRDKVVYDPVSKTWYSYAGTLPVVVPASFNPVGNANWKPRTDPDLRSDLETMWSDGSFPEAVRYKYGLPTAVDGAVFRALQEKLDDFVFLEDFGGGTDVPDNTDAFKKAFAVSKAVRLKNGTYHVVEGGIELPAQYLLVGEGRSTEIACGSNTAFTVTGALGSLKRAGIMRDLSISTDPGANILVYTHADQARFYNVFFYHIVHIMEDAHYFYFYDCESYGCYFEVKSGSNTASYLNESIVFLRSYFSTCNIYAKNTAELTLINCIMFSSPNYAVKTETLFLSPTANDEAIGFPVIVIGTTFDAIQGKCLDLKDAPYSVISGNFFASWTDAAVKLDSSRCVRLAENNIAAHGPGVDVADCKYLDISNNMFNECRTTDFGAINLTGSSYININGNTFAHAKVYGTDHSNKITKGITNNDATANHVLISSNVFGESVTEPTNISTSAGTGNRIVGNVGLYDSAGNRGETSSRPSNPNYGDMYYDTTLGLPIWWNAVSSTWKNAAGADV